MLSMSVFTFYFLWIKESNGYFTHEIIKNGKGTGKPVSDNLQFLSAPTNEIISTGHEVNKKWVDTGSLNKVVSQKKDEMRFSMTT